MGSTTTWTWTALTVERNLTIKGEGNTGGGDYITLTGGAVGGNLTAQTGKGDDWVTIDEYLVQKQLNIQTGDGNDRVVLEKKSDPGSTTERSSFVPASQDGMSADSIYVDLEKAAITCIYQGPTPTRPTYSGGAGHDAICFAMRPISVAKLSTASNLNYPWAQAIAL